VASHVSTCPAYLKLWKESPELALSPEDEMARHAAHRDSEAGVEEREQARWERNQGYIANNERKIEAQTQRWKSEEFRSRNDVSTPVKTPAGGRTQETLNDWEHDPDPARRVAGMATMIRVG